MDTPLKVAVIWHMHQPYYKDLLTGEFMLPWVRLHATKDYVDMATILDRFPTIRQTFNVVPSLLSQVEDYAKGEGEDIFLNLSRKPADTLTESDREFILCNFFLANWENMIKPFPRYWEILHKRGLHCSREEIRAVTRYFTDDEMRDLQCLFNLCWFDPSFLKDDPLLKGMVEKGRHYSEEEKEKLLDKQIEITGLVVPTYRRLMEEGRVELTTTPFYHPILPLLCDTDVAKRALPEINLPESTFRHPEDAKVQIERGVSYHTKTFGRPPAGMWPSEGSVSEEALALIASAGIKWVATDEEILEASTGERVERGKGGTPRNPEFLYRPYLYNAGGKDVALIFRDHQLSDLIGFVYSSWDPHAAAQDFMHKLHEIRKALGIKNREGEHLVPVILDGENCWEHYRNDGQDFLESLYKMVEEDPLIEMVTVSEHLEQHPPQKRLESVFPGSWINHNFRIWIGHDEDNLAWDSLKSTRDALVRAEEEGNVGEDDLKKAWEQIYIAEGSDWCWWYGDEHSTENDADFDNLFRKNLINVYTLIGQEPPQGLFKPIIQTEKHVTPPVKAAAFINPTIDGEVTSYFEWLGAADIELAKTGGTMHKVSYVLQHLFYGFNKENLYIRMDLSPDVEDAELAGLEVAFIVHHPKEVTVRVDNLGDCSGAVLVTEGKKISPEKLKAAFRDILEVEIPHSLHGAKRGEEIDCCVTVSRDGGEIERWPSVGFFSIQLPGDDFESETWNAYA